MAGILSSVMLVGLLTASPELFTFDGPEITARTVGNVGYFTQGSYPFTDLHQRGTGSAVFQAQDRVTAPRATYGDQGGLEATFELGGLRYRVELAQVGFLPPEAGVQPVVSPLPPPPNQPISGGVVTDRWLHGDSGLGFPGMTRVYAAAALWGVGRVWRNGELLTDAAIIHAAALSQGAHADDDTFRLLPVAREGDAELYVMVWNLPPEAEPRGFLQFGFDDVLIEVDGDAVSAVAVVPVVGVPGEEVVPTTPVPGGAALGAVPNAALGAGVGGAGLAGAREVPEPFLDPGRVTLETLLPGQPDVEGLPVDPFLGPGRTALAVEADQPGLLRRQVPGPAVTDLPADPFVDPARVTLVEELPVPTVGSFVPLAPAPQSTFLSTTGTFSVVPLVPGVPGPGFVFGGPRVTAGLVATPLTQGVETPAIPLVSTPRPINAQQPVPLVTQPVPLNANQPVPLISTPTPLNAQSVTATPPAPGVPAQ